MSFVLRVVSPLSVLGLAILACCQATAFGQDKAPADKAVEKAKVDKGEKPQRIAVKPIEKIEKRPDVSAALPSMQKLRESEESYRKAREVASKEIDAALEKAEAALAEAQKDLTAKDKDKDVRAKAQTAIRNLTEDIGHLKMARYRVHSPTLPQLQPQESRLAAKLEKVAELVAVQLKLEKGQGMVIAGVDKDGPADKAGLKVNDILIAIDGKAVTSELKDLRKILTDVPPDGAVTVTVLRAGAREKIGELKLPAATSK